MTVMRVVPDWTGPASPFRHTWEGLVNVDQFRWFVRRDTQEHLARARAELGARHVRAVGMMDDEMRVLGPDPTTFRKPVPAGLAAHPPRANWQVVDYCIDSLLDLGIAPMFTTAFMPGALAAGTRTVFTTRGRISPPKDPAAWADLVTDGVRHALARYGRQAVREWYFEVWNEPNLRDSFFEGTQDDFFRLWRTAWEAVKRADADLRLGGPSTARGEWLAEFLDWTRREGCPPDYIITHIYNNDSASQPLSPFDGPQEDRATTSPNFAAGVVRGTRRLLDGLGFRGEVHWNEWGRSWWPCFPDRETANEAAFVARTLADVSQEADRFAYWCLSDIYDQVGYGRETFHGNYGLLSLQGLRKPAYHAFQLLGRLGTARLGVAAEGAGPLAGAVATRGLASVAPPEAADRASGVLVYAAEAEAEYAPGRLDVRVALPAGVRPENLLLFRVTRGENNILRLWEDLGRPAYLRRDQRDLLRDANRLTPAATGTVEFAAGAAAPSAGAAGSSAGAAGPEARFALETPGLALLEIRPA